VRPAEVVTDKARDVCGEVQLRRRAGAALGWVVECVPLQQGPDRRKRRQLSGSGLAYVETSPRAKNRATTVAMS